MSQESVEAAYRRKLASNPDGEMDYITLQISHPLLSKTYYLVRGLQELTATLETGETITFEPTPMEASGPLIIVIWIRRPHLLYRIFSINWMMRWIKFR